MCGAFYVEKRSRALGKRELKTLRQAAGIPSDVRRHLERGSLPYISIGTVSDSWKISFVCGLTMYNAIDEIPVAIDSEGKYTYYGTGYQNLGNIINGWFAYTSTVGDEEYQADVINAMQQYLKRMSEANKEPLSEEENAAVMAESEDKEKHLETLTKMSAEIQKGGSDGRPS